MATRSLFGRLVAFSRDCSRQYNKRSQLRETKSIVSETGNAVPISAISPIFLLRQNMRGLAVSGAMKDDEMDAPTIIKPSNLIIDQGVTCSPFYSSKRSSQRTSSYSKSDLQEEAMQGVKEKGDGERQSDDADADADADHYPDVTSLSSELKPRLVIPLPGRLHVPISHFTTGDKETGSIHLDGSVFGCDPIREDILHRVVIYQRNKKRGKRYPAKTKTISEVRGSGRKVRPQKGTGQARAGHRRPAHWRGGAKAHGPKGIAQDYTTKLNKKVRRMGLRMALSQKLYEGNLVLVDDLAMPTHKTKPLAELLMNSYGIGKSGVSGLLIDDARENGSAEDDEGEDVPPTPPVISGVNANLRIASGNIFRVRVLGHLEANVYDILKHEKLVLSLAAVNALEARLSTAD